MHLAGVAQCAPDHGGDHRGDRQAGRRRGRQLPPAGRRAGRHVRQRTAHGSRDHRRAAGTRSLHGLVANRIPGRFQVRILASKEQARAGTVSFQYVAEPKGGAAARSTAPSRQRRKWMVVAAAVAGGAVAGIVATRGGAASPAAAVPSAPVPPVVEHRNARASRWASHESQAGSTQRRESQRSVGQYGLAAAAMLAGASVCCWLLLAPAAHAQFGLFLVEGTVNGPRRRSTISARCMPVNRLPRASGCAIRPSAAATLNASGGCRRGLHPDFARASAGCRTAGRGRPERHFPRRRHRRLQRLAAFRQASPSC